MAVFCALAIYLLPFILLQENGRYMVWDNLDAVHVYYKTLFESEKLFAPNSEVVVQMMAGIPRSSFPEEFSLYILLHYFMGPLGSYIATRVIVCFLGFLGMFLLLRKNLLSSECPLYIPLGVATCFAILPFWPDGQLSLAGIPLLVHCYLNIREGSGRWLEWGYLVFFPFYSSLVLSGVFIIFLLGILAIFDSVKKQKPAWLQFAALLCLSAFFIITHYRLFLCFFGNADYVSHRVEFEPVFGLYRFGGIFTNALQLLMEGQPHALSIHNTVVLPTVLFGLFLAIEKKMPVRIFGAGFAFLLITALLYGLAGSKYFLFVDSVIRSILPFHYTRFYFLMPVVWYTLFAISLYYISKSFRLGPVLVIASLIIQWGFLILHNDLVKGELGFYKGSPFVPKYSEFFAEKQFKHVQKEIGMPLDSFRVASIGIHPSVSIYNGFHTIDGYNSNYPLSYKHKFRTIISKELEKNIDIRNYFDRWGSRVYLFTAQNLGQMNTKWCNPKKITNLELDTDALKNLNVRYILSANEIEVETSPGLELLKFFPCNSSAWDLWVYSVK